ncbi:MAG: NAD(P)/FAD-dependent oxidoreductase [Clostridia bacterium]|nr:NAD(P)/FAD-dependent oxidoreductase [Clostridia bacterium]
MEYKIMQSPMKIGSCEIKNRIVLPPMLMGFGKFDGCVTEKMLNYYEERAKGGTGLIMTEITRVNDKTGSAAFAQLAASHDYHIESLRELANRIHKHGAKIFIQLHHPGRQNIGLLVGTVPLSIKLERWTKGGYGKMLYKLTPKVGPTLIKHNISPSSVAPSKCEPAYFAGGKVRALRHREIKQLEQQFINAALRVQKSGCDGVELHSAHGYLFQQFLSPHTNKRKDEYGGSLENRTRFLVNVLRGIKEKCGKDFPVVVRLSADECYAQIGEPNKGYNLKEGVEIAKILEANGADAIDVSSAGYDTFNYWLEPVSFELGWRKYMAKAIKEAVSIPVLAANLIRTPEQAEAQLEEGIQDFVSLGRPQIADPHWANKALSGTGTIKRCICCLNCIESMQNNAYIGGHGECSVNPFVGHENEELVCDGNGRKIAVIGAGPAGLVASEILAKRGFDVTLIEKNAVAGGQINLAAAPPHKGKTAWFIEDAVNACKECGVKILLNIVATPALIKELNPYKVIVASGSTPVKPKFGGNCAPESIYTFEDILSEKVVLENKRVAVIGSGMTGLETAHYLTEKGNTVTIVEMADEIAPGTWMQHKDDILPKLKKAGTTFMTGKKLTEINNDSIIVADTKKEKKQTEIKIEAVVLSLGSRPNAKIASALKEQGIESILIGDSTKVGRIADATKAAYKAAVAIK